MGIPLSKSELFPFSPDLTYVYSGLLPLPLLLLLLAVVIVLEWLLLEEAAVGGVSS